MEDVRLKPITWFLARALLVQVLGNRGSNAGICTLAIGPLDNSRQGGASLPTSCLLASTLDPLLLTFE